MQVTSTCILLLLIVERVLRQASRSELSLELVDSLLKHLAVALKLLHLECMSANRLLGRAVVLRGISDGLERSSSQSARPQTHTSQIGHECAQAVRFVTSRRIVALHRLVRLSRTLERLVELCNLSLEEADLLNVLLLGAPHFFFFAPFRVKLGAGLRSR